MKHRTGLMLFSVALGSFMSALDGSVVNISYPQIMEHFRISQETVEWVITAYLLIICSVLLFFGRLSDMYGQKRLFITGFGIFTFGSLLCSLSISIWMLIAFRVVQAVGASLMFSTNFAIITHNIPAERRGRAFSISAMAVAIALSAGPVLGGWLTEHFKWQSIFYINVPIGLIGLLMCIRFIPADRKKPNVPLDIPGSILIFAALFLILLPLDQIAEGMNIYIGAGMILLGVILAVLFIIYEKRAKAPILNLKLFKNRVFSAGLGASTLTFTAQNMVLFLLPLYLQTILGKSPEEAGTLMVFMPLAMLAIAPFAGLMSDRIDTRIVSSAGTAIMAAGLFMLSFLKTDTTDWYIRIVMAVTGLGCGMFQTPNNSAVMNHVPAESRGIASGTLATARNMGMVLGVGFSGALFQLFSGIAQRNNIEQGLTGIGLSNASFISGLRITFIIASIVALGAMTASFTKGKVLTGSMLEEKNGK